MQEQYVSEDSVRRKFTHDTLLLISKLLRRKNRGDWTNLDYLFTELRNQMLNMPSEQRRQEVKISRTLACHG